MTRHDDPSWHPEDDELVRAALMSLMDDVSTHPLPEPEAIRARAEGRGTSAVSDLAVRRSRRRSFAFLAGAAAAAVVATTAGLYVANQSPDHPTAASSTQEETTSSTSAAGSRLTMLDAGTWAAVLDAPVESTTTDAPAGRSCLEPTGDASWTRGAPRLADGDIPAAQWVGMPRGDSQQLTRAVDEALARCGDLTTTDRTRGTLTDDAAYRGWLRQDSDGTRTWWVEVTDGDGLSFLTVPGSESATGGHQRTSADIRLLARAVIGEADPTRTTSTSSTSTTTGTSSTTTPSPTTTVIPPPEPSGTGSDDTPATDPTDPPSSPSSPSSTTVEPARFVPAHMWSSQTLTGGEPTTAGPLHLEGSPPYIEACISSDLKGPVGATGIRSGPGDDNYFARQYIALAEDPDAAYSELLEGYGSGSCPGSATGGTVTQLTSTIFKLHQGDLTTYIAVVRMQGDGVSVLELNEAKTAPKPLTDSDAVSELTRMSDLAAAR